MVHHIKLALAVAAIAFTPAQVNAEPRGAAEQPIEGCRVVDGDTLRCGSERVHLLGIDAPEPAGHCREGRVCAPGDPNASPRSLEAALQSPLRIERVGTDRYGRTLALVRSNSHGDLSYWQIRQNQAIYKLGWDNAGRLAAWQ